MPSIEVKCGDRNILEKDRYADSPNKLTKQIEKNKQAKMPCSPFDKCNAGIPESPSSESCDGLHLKCNGLVHSKSTSLPAKPNMAPKIAEETTQEEKEEGSEVTKPAKDSQAGTEEVPATVSKSEKPKPRSFSLLEMKYNKDKEGKGRGHLVRQRSVKNSFEKETHKLSHAASAPAAISDVMEPHMEDEVFGEDEDKTSDCKQVGRDDTSSKCPMDVECLKKTSQDETEQELQENQVRSEKDEGMNIRKDEKGPQETKEASSSQEEDKTTKMSKEDVGKQQVEENQSGGGADEDKLTNENNESEKAVLDNTIKDDDEGSTQEKPKTKDDTADLEVLTQDLEKSLKLKDVDSKEELEDRPKIKKEQVSSLADDLEQGLSLEEKTVKPLIKTEVEDRIVSTEQGPTRLRSRGIQRGPIGMARRPDVILSTNNTVQQSQWVPSQPPSQTPNWQMPAHQSQGQTLPSLSVFLKPQMRPATQPAQSVVCPPGQGSQPRMYMGPPGTCQVGSVVTQSRQRQYAQNLFYETAHTSNCSQPNRGGSAFQSQQPMNIPGESTGTPSEVEWPPTPPSEVDDILSLIESEEESVMSPVENDENSQFGSQVDIHVGGVPSPQSPWGGSHSASISSVSPVPSPYAGSQQSSPYPQVPDINGPWSPESNAASPGDPRSPDSSIFIKPAGGMSAGKVTVSPMSPHSPSKRLRSSSSTESEEMHVRINDIKDFLEGKPDASPILSPYHHGYWQNSSQSQPSFTSINSPYITAAAPQMPVQSYPAPVSAPYFQVNTPQPSPQPSMYQQQPATPPEGELDAFRRQLSEWSVEELLAPDEDKDTVLHLAICQTKVALSLAIIERICSCKQKQCLNVQNKLHQTPLYLSVISNIPYLMQILINYGADLFISNKHGNTPLHAAARSGNNEAIQAICDGMLYCGYTEENARRLFDTTNFEGKTALMLAVESHYNQDTDGNIIDCSETVRMLLTNFASSLQQDSKSGKTALHYAVELRKVDLICILLEHCEDAGRLVNSQMYDGNTALHLIVGRALPEDQILHIVYLLMNRGANVGMENAAREKPLDLVHREHREIKRRLHGQGNQKK